MNKLLLYLLLLSMPLLGQQGYKFEHLTVNDGLAQAYVRNLTEDNKGQVWISTINGLSVFDAYEFKTYTRSSKAFSLSHDHIYRTAMDAVNNRLWLATREGFSVLDLKKEQFRNYGDELETGDRTNLSKRTYDAWVDEQGVFWGASYLGLFRYDYNRDSIYQLFDFENSCLDYWRGKTKTNNNCTSFYRVEGHRDNRYLWLSGDKGIYLFDKKEKTFKSYAKAAANHPELLAQRVNCLYRDKNQNVWVSASNKLLRYNEKLDSFEVFPLKGIDSKQFNVITCLLQIEEDTYWLGTANAGVWILKGDTIIHQLKHDPLNSKSLSSDKITCLAQTKDQTIWVGNSTNGVDIYRQPDNIFKYYPNTLQNGFSGNNIKGVTVTKQGIWTVSNNYLDCYDRKTGKVSSNVSIKDAQALVQYKNEIWAAKGEQIYVVSQSNQLLRTYQLPTQKLHHKRVYQFVKDGQGNLWIMTACGMLLYDATKDAFEEYLVYGEGCAAWFFATYDRTRNTIWAGTYGYLVAFNLTTKTIVDWTPVNGALDAQYDYNDPNLLYYKVEDAKVDKKGRLWVVARDSGLLKIEIYNRTKTKLTTYREADGLVNNETVGMLLDDEGYIWIMTTKGLSRFDPEKETFKNFSQQTGLPSNHHNTLAYHQDEDGIIYVGTNNGLYSFDSEEITEVTDLCPSVVINKFEINNKPTPIDENGVLQESIQELNEIALDYTNRIISIGFSAINHAYPKEITYAYQLEGINEDWVYVGEEERIATYTSLREGTYKFKVKASNYWGQFGTDYTTLKIVQYPPYWRSKWAYMCYVLLAMLMIYCWIKWREYQLNQEKIRLEQEVKERTKKIQEDQLIIEQQSNDLKALDKLKSRFFANISHELRTPLTLILGPLKKILNQQQVNTEVVGDLQMMERNGQQLLKLIEEILDLSKLEVNKLEVQEEEVVLERFVRRIFYSFESLANYKQIVLQFNNTLVKDLMLYLDKDKVEKILNNLLSNALKFTPKNGKISLEITKEKEQLCIHLSDTGIGISASDLPFIFDRFYQSKNPLKRAEGGTGIGLALSKELVGLLKGSLDVESTVGKGTTFLLKLPHKLAYADESFVSLEEEELIQPLAFQLNKPKIIEGNKALKILVVEDNFDMQDFIRNILMNYYGVIVAGNGEEALNILTNQSEEISLIVSDVMMPIIDGFQLLETLKSSDVYRKIPVVMLTARADISDKLHALRIGVDDYLTKPFDEQELLIRIENLLQNYQARQDWAVDDLINTQTSALNAQAIVRTNELVIEETTARKITIEDQNWLIKLEELVKKECRNTNFTVDWLAAEMTISVRQLQRKLKKLTGLTPKKYITEVRLQVARTLLENKTYNTIAQVMYEVGFSKPQYFAKIFAERFGCLPSEI